MKREFKERFARLERAPGIDRVSSGSPAAIVIRPADSLAGVRTISAIEALVRRGVGLRAL